MIPVRNHHEIVSKTLRFEHFWATGRVLAPSDPFNNTLRGFRACAACGRFTRRVSLKGGANPFKRDPPMIFSALKKIVPLSNPSRGFRRRRRKIAPLSNPLRGFRWRWGKINPLSNPLRGFQRRRRKIAPLSNPLRAFRRRRRKKSLSNTPRGFEHAPPRNSLSNALRGV